MHRVCSTIELRLLYRKLSLLSVIMGTISIPLARSMPLARGDDAIERGIGAIRAVGKEGQGSKQAMTAAADLRQLPSDRLFDLLEGFEDANPVAENWLRGIVADAVRHSGPPSLESLEAYATDRSHSKTGRAIAIELIAKKSPDSAAELIDRSLNDPSLAVREMAIERAIERGQTLVESDRPDEAIAEYREALAAVRNPQQLERIRNALDNLGDKVSTARAFAMIVDWMGVGPFDNAGGVGFDTQYEPERQATAGGIDFNATYQGKAGPTKWKKITGSSDEGLVDLAAAYDKEKGAASYLATTFASTQERPAQVRLRCVNANKIWVNGREVMQNEVYHAGSMVDQYIASIQLREGENIVLLKICQNEQTESWAQEWEFQFRITDTSGKGLRSGE